MSTSKSNKKMIEEFTSSEEMDEYMAGDETIDFFGYIHSIEGSKLVGAKIRKTLYKFIVNNGKGRKMCVLMWEEIANKYEALLRCRDIIRISNGKALAVNLNYANVSDDVIGVEISVQRATKIEIEGQLKTDDDIQCCTKVLLKDASTTDSHDLIAIEGFIKTPFFTSMTGNSSYGMGAITDGHILHIAIYFCTD